MRPTRATLRSTRLSSLASQTQPTPARIAFSIMPVRDTESIDDIVLASDLRPAESDPCWGWLVGSGLRDYENSPVARLYRNIIWSGWFYSLPPPDCSIQFCWLRWYELQLTFSMLSRPPCLWATPPRRVLFGLGTGLRCVVSFPRERVWCSERLLVTAPQSESSESDCRTHNYMQWRKLSTRSSMRAVQCMGNAIITFFAPFNPAPCDKNVAPLFRAGVTCGEGLGTRLIPYRARSGNPMCLHGFMCVQPVEHQPNVPHARHSSHDANAITNQYQG